MDKCIKEHIARDISEMMAWFIFGGSIIAIGFLIDEVDDTIYPPIAVIAMAYVGAGDFIMALKEVHPKLSNQIKNGKIDIDWGFKYLYWSCWWPLYVKNKRD